MKPEAKIQIEKNKSLKALNTFGIEARAPFFCQVHSIEALQGLFQDQRFRAMPLLVLGGGSNILFTRDPEGLVIHNKIGGIKILNESDTHVEVSVGSGVIWHEFVLYCIARGWAGLENLSLIPGSSGAAPMQNIGAYGVELKDCFLELQALRRSDATLRTFNKEACAFGYRSSIFKTSEKDQWVICSVSFRLSKEASFNTSYGAIRETLQARGLVDEGRLSLKAVSDAVIHIRQSKLPDPVLLGNAGSFFKNPVIGKTHFNRLQQNYPHIPSYPQSEGVKVPAGWLIEQCGWKGYRRGPVGVHDKQALVLVNHGGARGQEIRQLAEAIQASVKEKFNIALEAEVNII